MIKICSCKSVLLLLLLAHINLGLSANSYFQRYGLNQGLDQLYTKEISQDHLGYLWIGTISGLYKFDGFNFEKIILNEESPHAHISSIYADNSDRLWVATKNNGVFLKSNGSWQTIGVKNYGDENVTLNSFAVSSGGDIFAGSSIGLLVFKSELSLFEPFDDSQLKKGKLVAIKFINETELFILKSDEVLKLSLNDFKIVSLFKNDNAAINHTFEVDDEMRLWLGSSEGLLVYDLKSNQYVSLGPDSINSRVVDLLIYDGVIWVGTIFEGLIKINLNIFSAQAFISHPNQPYTLSESSVTALFLSRDNVLWVGTFSGGLNSTVLNGYDIDFYPKQQIFKECFTGKKIFEATVINDDVRLSGEGGIGLINFKDNLCQPFSISSNNSVAGFTAFSSWIDEFENHWISTSEGLKMYSSGDYSKDTLNEAISEVVFFSFENLGMTYIGTTNGLKVFKHSDSEQHVAKIENVDLGDATFLSYIEYEGSFYFATSKGLGVLTKENELKKLSLFQKQTSNSRINAVSAYKGGLLISIEDSGIKHINMNGGLVEDWGLKDNMPSRAQFYSMEVDRNNSVWMVGNYGFMRYDPMHDAIQLFDSNDGFINENYMNGLIFRYSEDKLALIGNHGITLFDPLSIYSQSAKFNVTLTNIYFEESLVINEVNVEPNEARKFNDDVNNLKILGLTHRDNTVGFEFNLFDYADPVNNIYQYRMLGLSKKWKMVEGKNRKVTFNNLRPGEYEFQVKAANKNGVWSKENKSLKITVKPAPWLSPWAFALYALILVVAVFLFIRLRTASVRKRAVELEAVVTERTQELKTQKQMVESLLNHKNELFANVTHEFKTPLALIKGPTEQLLDEPELYPFKTKLNMITRNANRLLVMVGQILKLSEVEQDHVVVREYQGVKPVLDMIFESFKPLADDKNISLKLENASSASIYGTPELLEMVVGNLLSNAIKYTQTGGQVTLTSEDQADQVFVEVSDTGPGIAVADQNIIFDRFTRLDKHREVQGTGIGLAVVKEITQANGGHIEVISEVGRGSLFKLCFQAVEDVESEHHHSELLHALSSHAQNELRSEKKPLSSNKKTHKITILIIEDNLDMQSHIGDVLSKQFNCLFAARGKQGVALALKEMPDIVICDVMMPGMDGFQVTRVLRNDANTSHIPVVLLTALNTKESRIKGWRENIDVYLTKPFDGKELNATIHAIISVRKILQEKTQASLSIEGSTESLDLSAQDLKFIKKLKAVIAENFHDAMFMRPQIASSMAVSERQLQRKVKALIDESPMSLLRSYRLEMAANKLNDGFQVSIVGDECGFSSVSYFAACFKKKYGMTPKKYQMLKK